MSCRILRGCMWAAQAELAVLGSLCGFSCGGSGAALDWRADGLRLLDSLYRQLAAAEACSAPLLQRLFQGAYQPFGEALEAWAFRAEGMPYTSSSFATELPSDLRDLLPEDCQDEVHVVYIHDMRCFTLTCLHLTHMLHGRLLPSNLHDLLPAECQQEVHVIHIPASGSHACMSFAYARQTAHLLWQSDVEVCI